MRPLAWRACYELLAARGRKPEWAFMNYGYAPLRPDDVPPALEPADEVDRLCIQLYAHALGDVDLRDTDVLEVGCGRGGGASYVSRYLSPRTTTGLDFSRQAVALCTRHRQGPGLSFVHGQAQPMPFPDACFDAVLNIESSHCYGSMEPFLAEVCRVLRPGGHFLFADLRSRDDADRLHRQLAGCVLDVRAERDISANVLHAMRLDDARKLDLIDAWIPWPFRRSMRGFAGIEGTANHTGLETGEVRYLSAHLVKAAGP